MVEKTKLTTDSPQQLEPLVFRLVKNKTFLIVALSSVVIVTTAILLRVLTPPTEPSLSSLPELTSPLPKPSITNVSERVMPTKKITFTGEKPTVPAEAAIFRSTFAQGTSDAIATQLANDLNLQPAGQLAWKSADNSIQLHYLTQDGFIVLDANLTSPETTTFSQEELVDKTQAFMRTYLQKNPADSFPIEYWKQGDEAIELETSTDPTAQYAYVTLTPRLNNMPAVLQNHSETVNFVLFNNKYEVVRFVLTPELYSFEAIARTRLISFDDALKQIEQGNYIIVDSYKPFRLEPSQIESVENTTFDKVVLEYRLDPTTDFYTPYYHFYGSTAQSYEDPIFFIEVITPAVTLAS